MNLPMLQELEAELLEQGYSKSYARRLAGELMDHAIESAQDQSVSTDDDRIEELSRRLGPTDKLVQAVNHYRELDPIPKRYPFLCFVALPVIALNLLILVVLNLLYSWLPDSNSNYRILTAQSWNFLYYGMLATGPIAAVFLSRRYRVPPVYVFLSVVVLSASSLFGTVVATCSQSSSTFIHSEWAIRWQQLIIPAASVLVVFVAARWSPGLQYKHSNATNVMYWIRQFDAKVAFGYSVILVALLFGSQMLIDSSLQSLKKHPVDNLVESFNSDTFRVGRAFEVLRSGAIEFDPQQQNKIDVLISDLDKQVADNFERMKECDTSWKRERADEDLRIASVQAFDTVSSILSPDQIDFIRIESLRSVGWMAVFDHEVRQSIDLSAFQFERFKDEYLASIKRQNRLYSKWRKANMDDRKLIEDEIKENRSLQKSKFAAILSAEQSSAFRRYLNLEDNVGSEITLLR